MLESVNEAGCPVCHSHAVDVFAEVPNVPVLCNILWPSREEAQSVARVDVRLGFCPNCGHVFNPDFDLSLMDYSQVYENSLHFSPRFQQYADDLARDLVVRHDLYDKHIIEIGSGKGDFLEMLCELGNNQGIGFDPSYIPGETARSATKQIEFIQDFYSERYTDRRADFICCRHTLEHIPDPVAFMQMVRRTIGQQNTAVFFEVPNGLYTLQDMAIWDIIYEHCSYFTKYSLAYLFESSGFEVTDVRTTFGGQYLCIEARPKNDFIVTSAANWNQPREIAENVRDFSNRYRAKRSQDQMMLSALADSGRQAVIWGSGSKGITFLNMLPEAEIIHYAVDINPRKQGMYITGPGQLIVAPEFLSDYAPDAVIVMNPLYTEEIRTTLEGMGLNADLYSA
ncbi:MAG: methyltransferase domain-containing protein [Caldilineaceae bacterium]|nr:methyltransferase domain-containing protein [Caldilineaceae bacterium]